MFNARRFIQARTRRAKRGGALLLVLVWTMVWVSQAYAACCGSRSGTHRQSMIPAVEAHAIVPSAHEGCPDPQEPCRSQMVDENLPIGSAQPSVVDDGRFAGSVVLQRSPPLLLELPEAGNDRIPDAPDPSERAYLRLQRLLI